MCTASTPSSASLIGARYPGPPLNRSPGVPITPPSSPFIVDALDLVRHNFKYWARPAHFDNPRRIPGSLGSTEWHREQLSGGSMPSHDDHATSYPFAMRHSHTDTQARGPVYSLNKRKRTTTANNSATTAASMSTIHDVHKERGGHQTYVQRERACKRNQKRGSGVGKKTRLSGKKEDWVLKGGVQKVNWGNKGPDFTLLDSMSLRPGMVVDQAPMTLDHMSTFNPAPLFHATLTPTHITSGQTPHGMANQPMEIDGPQKWKTRKVKGGKGAGGIKEMDLDETFT